VGAGTAGGIVALVFAAIMAATVISGFCPLYLLLGRLSGRRKLA
jgi:Inner membrane protein YgaP-like, transmembrane domain